MGRTPEKDGGGPCRKAGGRQRKMGTPTVRGVVGFWPRGHLLYLGTPRPQNGPTRPRMATLKARRTAALRGAAEARPFAKRGRERGRAFWGGGQTPRRAGVFLVFWPFAIIHQGRNAFGGPVGRPSPGIGVARQPVARPGGPTRSAAHKKAQAQRGTSRPPQGKVRLWG